MAFLDDAEATTYRMLKHVLQNHWTTHRLCLPHTLVTCGALVAFVCASRDETRGALEPMVAHTLADLKHSTRARRSRRGLTGSGVRYSPRSRPITAGGTTGARAPAREVGDARQRRSCKGGFSCGERVTQVLIFPRGAFPHSCNGGRTCALSLPVRQAEPRNSSTTPLAP